LDVIYVDTPSGKIVEVSSSCDLSIFSLGADPQRAEGVEVTPEGSLSMSIGELWHDIHKLDEINRGGASTLNIPEVGLCEKKPQASVKKIDKHARRRGKGVLLDNASWSSNVLTKGYGKGSVKKKAEQILSGAPRAISPHMRRSFVDKQYTPSIGMGLSEWKISLEELTRVGYIVKKEPDSDGNE
jgi:hypothetical protein